MEVLTQHPVLLSCPASSEKCLNLHYGAHLWTGKSHLSHHVSTQSTSASNINVPVNEIASPYLASTMAACLALLVSLDAKQGWSCPSLNGRPDGAGSGVGGPVRGAHPSGLHNIPNAPETGTLSCQRVASYE